MKHLIIIPGVGDRGWRYRWCMPFWTLRGYRVHIFVFGWARYDRSFEELMGRFLAFIDNLSAGECHVIGASAGGTVAINALAARPVRVTRIVTVCTPYVPVPELHQPLLDESLTMATAKLSTMEAKLRQRITSVYALWDGVIPTSKSKPVGVTQKTLLAWGTV